jgi:hypothetical protein
MSLKKIEQLKKVPFFPCFCRAKNMKITFSNDFGSLPLDSSRAFFARQKDGKIKRRFTLI